VVKHGYNDDWVRRDVLVEDGLNKVTVQLWNEKHHLVENIRTVRIKNLTTHVFYGMMCLNSTDQTSIAVVSIYV
jgi:ssDNA-binding replication factor A large subunit